MKPPKPTPEELRPKPRFSEPDEERAARLVDIAKQLAAPKDGALESSGQALPSAAKMTKRITRRMRSAGLPESAAKAIAKETARKGLELIKSAGRGDLRHEDMSREGLANLEAVISAVGRPAWFVRGNAADPDEAELGPAEQYWLVHISNQLVAISQTCRKIGAIFKEEDGTRTEIGTGWMIGPRLLATNAHVALHLFFRRKSFPAGDPRDGWRPRPGVTGSVDFCLENGGDAPNRFALGSPCFVESDRTIRPDLAIIAVEPRDGTDPPKAITLEQNADRVGGWKGALLFVLGHPIADLQGDPNVVTVFGALDGTKRFSPGESLGRLGDYVLAHDCSTVNGSSGSAVLDFATAKAIGLHYWGKPGARNESVFLPAIKDHPAVLKTLGGGFGG